MSKLIAARPSKRSRSGRWDRPNNAPKPFDSVLWLRQFAMHNDKKHILDAIQRTAKANGGKPLGTDRLLRETGIKESDWKGKYWARWGDALHEPGFTPNEFTKAPPRIG
jgi:hypothetical protein